MDKVKIADNMCNYYKQMLMLKRKILMHDDCFIKSEEADFESGDVSKILLSDNDIEKLSLLVKKSILRGNRILEQSGRDFHIIRNLLLKIEMNWMRDCVYCAKMISMSVLVILLAILPL